VSVDSAEKHALPFLNEDQIKQADEANQENNESNG
jgi:hypothetical protein